MSILKKGPGHQGCSAGEINDIESVVQLGFSHLQELGPGHWHLLSGEGDG